MHSAYETVGAKSLIKREVPTVEPKAGEVLLELNAVGICGSDHHIYLGHHPYIKLPVVQGHEFCGTVRAYGPDCSKTVAIGTRVVVEPLQGCGHCYACSLGRYNCCEDLKIYGVHVPGAFQELLAVPERLLHPVPDLPSHIAVFAEPVSIAVQAVRRGRVTAEDKVLILGAGPIGLALVLACKDIGASVSISDVIPSRLQKALRLGADFVFQSGKDEPQKIRDDFQGGATVVIDAVGVADAIQLGVNSIRSAGRFVLVGMNGQNLPIQISTIIGKEIDVIGSRNSAEVFADAVSLVRKNKERIAELIHCGYGLDKLQEMMEFSIHNPSVAEKVVVQIKSD